MGWTCSFFGKLFSPKKKGFLQQNIPFFQQKFIVVWNFTPKLKTILTSDISQPICHFLNQKKKLSFFFLEFKQFLEKFINFLNSQNMEKVKKNQNLHMIWQIHQLLCRQNLFIVYNRWTIWTTIAFSWQMCFWTKNLWKFCF